MQIPIVFKYKFLSIGGNGCGNPAFYRQLIVTPIVDILSEDLDESIRIISGDVLSGAETVVSNAINYLDEVLSLIKPDSKREFLGWLKPGFNKYSLSNAFFSKLLTILPSHTSFKIDTQLNGSVRSIIPMGNWDNVLPMNILTEFLVKSILIKDIDMMEKLGIYECDPEDFALCSFACQYKVEVSSIIQEGLKIMEYES